MKKFEVAVTKQNNVETIKYTLGAADVYDDRAADKATQLGNIIPLQYSDEDGVRSITSYVHGDESLNTMLTDTLEKKEVLCVLNGLASAFEIGTQGIPVSYILKDINHIYVNRETFAVKCVLIPVKQEVMPLAEIPVFFREIVSRMMFAEEDTDNYVAKILTLINSNDFSVAKLKTLISEQLEKIGLFVSKENGLVNLSEKAPAETSNEVKVNKLGVMSNMQNAMYAQNGQQPPMGQPPMGQPPMGQPPMGQSPMGQPPMGQPLMGQRPPMGQPPMGQAPMGQPPMGQRPPMGQPPMGQPMPQMPRPVTGQPMPQAPNPVMGQPMPQAPNPVMGQPMPQMPRPVAGQPMPQAPNPVTGQPMPQAPNPVMGQPMSQMPRPVAGQPMPQALNPVTGQPMPQAPNLVTGQSMPQAPNPVTGQPMPQIPKPVTEQPEPKPTAEEEAPKEEVSPEPNQETTQLKQEDERVTHGNLVGQMGTKPIPHLVRKKTGEEIYITKPEFAIGKSQTKADYVIEDNTAVSRVHCIIVQRDGVNYIKDNNSTNHTYLNGVELEPNKETLLKNKTVIQMSDEEFTFLLRKGE